MRFSTQTSGAPTGDEWLARVRRIEELGYGTVSMPDHVAGGTWAPLLGLAAAAVATRTLRLGTLVIDNDFRNPLLLARELAVVDVVSDGRLEIGLGAGWLRTDYTSLGIPYDRGWVRAERLAEAVTILKRLFTEEEVTFEGRYYRHTRATSKPRTVQRPHPPFLIAAGGDRLLDLAGREADIAQIHPQPDPTGQLREPRQVAVDAAREQIAVIDAAARGRDVELSCYLDVVLADDREAEIAKLAAERQVTRESIAASIYRPIGTLSEVRAHILRVRADLGITYFCIRGPHADACAPLVRELSGRS